MQLVGRVPANKVAAAERIVNAGRAPNMFDDLRGRLRMALVNIGRDELLPLGVEGEAVPVHFDRVSDVFRWSDLFPEWIDEEEEDEGPSCPELPMPDLAAMHGGDVDVVVAALPCNRTARGGWNRDVFRLQVHLAAALAAARRARRDGDGRVLVVLRSECEPMVDLFRCDEAVGREGEWWMYRVDVDRLEEKLQLPVGSCNLAMPLWGPGGTYVR
jgi:xylan alpha-glucuronosyltransferase